MIPIEVGQYWEVKATRSSDAEYKDTIWLFLIVYQCSFYGKTYSLAHKVDWRTRKPIRNLSQATWFNAKGRMARWERDGFTNVELRLHKPLLVEDRIKEKVIRRPDQISK